MDDENDSPRRSSIPPELKKTIPISEYRYLSQCQEQFEKLADWVLENLNHQIGMGNLVEGEGAVDTVTRLLHPMADPGYMGHISFVKADDGAVCSFGSLWDPKCALATQGSSIYEVLEEMKEVISLYEAEIGRRWGHEVLTGQWGTSTVAYRNQIVRAANELQGRLVELDQHGLVGVEAGPSTLIVYLVQGTSEYDGPWTFGPENFRVNVEYVEEDVDNFEELVH